MNEASSTALHPFYSKCNRNRKKASFNSKFQKFFGCLFSVKYLLYIQLIFNHFLWDKFHLNRTMQLRSGRVLPNSLVRARQAQRDIQMHQRGNQLLQNGALGRNDRVQYLNLEMAHADRARQEEEDDRPGIRLRNRRVIYDNAALARRQRRPRVMVVDPVVSVSPSPDILTRLLNPAPFRRDGINDATFSVIPARVLMRRIDATRFLQEQMAIADDEFFAGNHTANEREVYRLYRNTVSLAMASSHFSFVVMRKQSVPGGLSVYSRRDVESIVVELDVETLTSDHMNRLIVMQSFVVAYISTYLYRNVKVNATVVSRIVELEANEDEDQVRGSMEEMDRLRSEARSRNFNFRYRNSPLDSLEFLTPTVARTRVMNLMRSLTDFFNFDMMNAGQDASMEPFYTFFPEEVRGADFHEAVFNYEATIAQNNLIDFSSSSGGIQLPSIFSVSIYPRDDNLSGGGKRSFVDVDMDEEDDEDEDEEEEEEEEQNGRVRLVQEDDEEEDGMEEDEFPDEVEEPEEGEDAAERSKKLKLSKASTVEEALGKLRCVRDNDAKDEKCFIHCIAQAKKLEKAGPNARKSNVLRSYAYELGEVERKLREGIPDMKYPVNACDASLMNRVEKVLGVRLFIYTYGMSVIRNEKESKKKRGKHNHGGFFQTLRSHRVVEEGRTPVYLFLLLRNYSHIVDATRFERVMEGHYYIITNAFRFTLLMRTFNVRSSSKTNMNDALLDFLTTSSSSYVTSIMRCPNCYTLMKSKKVSEMTEGEVRVAKEMKLLTEESNGDVVVTASNYVNIHKRSKCEEIKHRKVFLSTESGSPVPYSLTVPFQDMMLNPVSVFYDFECILKEVHSAGSKIQEHSPVCWAAAADYAYNFRFSPENHCSSFLEAEEQPEKKLIHRFFKFLMYELVKLDLVRLYESAPVVLSEEMRGRDFSDINCDVCGLKEMVEYDETVTSLGEENMNALRQAFLGNKSKLRDSEVMDCCFIYDNLDEMTHAMEVLREIAGKPLSTILKIQYKGLDKDVRALRLPSGMYFGDLFLQWFSNKPLYGGGKRIAFDFVGENLVRRVLKPSNKGKYRGGEEQMEEADENGLPSNMMFLHNMYKKPTQVGEGNVLAACHKGCSRGFYSDVMIPVIAHNASSYDLKLIVKFLSGSKEMDFVQMYLDTLESIKKSSNGGSLASHAAELHEVLTGELILKEVDRNLEWEIMRLMRGRVMKDKTGKISLHPRGFQMISCIPNTKELFTSFQIGPFRFVDSFRFFPSSLKNFVASYDTKDMQRTLEYRRSVKFPLLDVNEVSKLKIPFSCFTKLEDYEGKELPYKNLSANEAFNQVNLCGSNVSESEIDFYERCFKASGVDHKEFVESYCIQDVTMLLDCFHMYRNFVFSKFQIDMLRSFTLPGSSEKAWKMLARTNGTRIEIPHTEEVAAMYPVLGGISQINRNLFIANNKYLPHYDPSQRSSFILYVDANNLYGGAMSEYLPCHSFRFMSQEEIEEITENLEEWLRVRVEDSLVFGRPLEDALKMEFEKDHYQFSFDIEEIPIHVQEKYRDYPLIQFHGIVNHADLSLSNKTYFDQERNPHALSRPSLDNTMMVNNTALKLHVPDVPSSAVPQDALMQAMFNPDHSNLTTLENLASSYCYRLQNVGSTNPTSSKVSGVKKLLSSFNRTDYVDCKMDFRRLYLLVRAGYKIRVRKILTCKMQRSSNEYIQMCTESRAKSKTKSEKDVFKLFANSHYGKKVENVNNRANIEVAHEGGERDISYFLGDNRLELITKISDDISLVGKTKAFVLQDKPTQQGSSILDLSKVHMTMFYERMKEVYPDMEVLATDTDSLILGVYTEDFFHDLATNKQLFSNFDFSKFKKQSHDLSAPLNKVVEDFQEVKSQRENVPGFLKDELEGNVCSTFIGLRSKCYSYESYNPESKSFKHKIVCKGVPTGLFYSQITMVDFANIVLSSDPSMREMLEPLYNRYFDYYKTSPADRLMNDHIKSKLVQCYMIRSERMSIFTQKLVKVGINGTNDKRWYIDSIRSVPFGYYRVNLHEELLKTVPLVL